jgi:transposase
MDNLSVHKAKEIKSQWDADFIYQFLPPYSSTLNPIERLWSVIKGQWRKTCHMGRQDNKEENERVAINRIRQLIENVDRQKQHNLARSHYPFLARSLRGIIV